MARIPDAELERIKREVSLERLVEARGVELRRHGADLIGRCPFHDDREPSLVVSPTKNLWHCLGECQQGGSVVDWVMKAEGVSFRYAVELLRADFSTLAARRSAEVVKRSSVVKLPPPLEIDADDREQLRQVVAYYHETLKQSPEARAYLESRGIHSEEAIDRFKLGFANRTLGYRLPDKNRVAGAEIRGRLQRLGILRESGHEHFNGSIVIPVLDEEGNVAELYGRKITPNLRPGTPLHLYLPGPHRGVWNLDALRVSKEIILCEALVDALTFWCAGYRNVTASYGVEGFTADHVEAMKRYGTERVLIAYDRDDAGEAAAQRLSEELLASGIGCYRIHFPKGMDANEYAQKVKPAEKSLALVIRNALWLGKGKAAAPTMEREEEAVVVVEHASESETALAAEEEPGAQPVRILTEEDLEPQAPATSSAPVSPLAAEPLGAAAELEPEASPEPPAPKAAEIPTEVKPEEVVIRLGDRRYRIRGLTKNPSFDSLKVNVLTAREDTFHVDTLDLYSARQRAAYVKQAAVELGIKEEILRKDLGRVLMKLEELQEEQIRKALEPKDETVTLSDPEKAAALDLLRSPMLLDRIVADFERCGVVGEETNKLVGYLAAISRKLEEPLAVIIQSSSAAGKSSLMDAVLALVPEEERVKYSAMTGQSLFYMGETDLKGKVLAIVEEAGAERAAYALKLLQSEGELTIASTGKDPATGKLVTHEYRVEGPVAIFLTTTAVEIDEELLNRAIVLTVDENREQTRAIHRLQRERQTLEGLLARRDRDEILSVHQNAQRLLRPLLVANPFARSLTFFDSRTRTRRDHMKYLTLIRTIALLHQHQRPVRTIVHGEKTIEYVEVTLDDIAIANRLAAEVLGRSLDELAPQTRRLLMALDEMATEECKRREIERADYRFSRREIVERTGLGYTQVRLHLDRLIELEHVLVHHGGRGQSFVYELLYDGKGKDGEPFLSGLIAIAGATSEPSPTTTTTATLRGSGGGFAGSSRPHDGGIAGPSRPHAETRSDRPRAAFRPASANGTSESTLPAPVEAAPSHTNGDRRSDGVFPLAARVSLNTGGGF